jgi:hypothetical protein
MAGGMWVVTGVGVAAGLAFGGGGTALYELGSATARGELVKLQITFKLAILDTNRDMAKAQAVIERLMAEADETRVVLAEERELNEANADRVRTIEATLEAIEETIGWMRSEQREAAGVLDHDLVVTLTYASDEHGSLQHRGRGSARCDTGNGRPDRRCRGKDRPSRRCTRHRHTGNAATRARSVPTPAPVRTWDELVAEATRRLGDERPHSRRPHR